ncbi:MAG: hypothetical protein Q4G22_15550 [Paracoccus sp. (in: a-proteobacteria)]|uniref:hypothetical protein n=1 Tax=Paracoccus sp. TaxID=267 RepID=UPI0026DF48DB|nr:hypothetical protein [Paracoccus sp. (in: a-proteobacteria)]MDO5633226.1 hypothetical protein [Paracoccus sp. (in: a-proteobacteria)]
MRGEPLPRSLRFLLAVLIGQAVALVLAASFLPIVALFKPGPYCPDPSLGRCLEEDVIWGLLIYGPGAAILGLLVLTPLIYFWLSRR